MAKVFAIVVPRFAFSFGHFLGLSQSCCFVDEQDPSLGQSAIVPRTKRPLSAKLHSHPLFCPVCLWNGWGSCPAKGLRSLFICFMFLVFWRLFTGGISKTHAIADDIPQGLGNPQKSVIMWVFGPSVQIMIDLCRSFQETSAIGGAQTGILVNRVP